MMTKAIPSQKLIPIICLLVCVASTLIWLFTAFPGEGGTPPKTIAWDAIVWFVAFLLWFLSPYCLFWVYNYKYFFRPPLSILVSIGFVVVSLAGYWLWLTPSLARKADLIIFFFPEFFWAAGIFLALAGGLTRILIKPGLALGWMVAVFVGLTLTLYLVVYVAAGYWELGLIELPQLMAGAALLFLLFSIIKR